MKYLSRIAGLITVMASLALAQGAEGTPQKIMALESLWSQATAARDLKAVDRLLDDSFVYVDFDGKLTSKAQVMADLQISGMQHAVVESMVVKMHGSSGIVTGIFSWNGIKNGRTFQHRGRFVDTWAYKDGNWVCVVAQVTPIVQ